MVGHKLGEFSPTRQFSGHTPADKKAAQTAALESTTASTTPGATKTPGATIPPGTTKPKEGSSNAKK